jgi:uncharacterized protein (TIGR02594 family)
MKKDIIDVVTKAALEANIDPSVLLKICEVESSGNPNATNGSHLGLLQLTREEFGGGDIFDPRLNAAAGARVLRAHADRFEKAHGRPPASWELYLIHQQGWSGYHALAAAAPGVAAWRALEPYYATPERAHSAINGNLPAGTGAGADITAVEFLEHWRARIDPPAWYVLACDEEGVKEAPGAADNNCILNYYRDAGHAEVKHDSVAWCAAFVGAMLHRAGIAPSGSLMARSYLKWGARLTRPRMGAICVLWRESPSSALGHVGFVAGWNTTHVRLLGGNQSDSVGYEDFPRSRILAFIWPTKKVNMMSIKEVLSDILVLSPTLAKAMGGPLEGAVLMAVERAVGGDDPAATLRAMSANEAAQVLREAENIIAPALQSTNVSLMTVFDRLFGVKLVGWKTYIVIILATLLNGLAGLDVLPAILTPDVVTMGNTLLTGLGGAALVSKVERYVQIAAGFIKPSLK